MFLLVPAYLGSPGQRVIKRLCVCCGSASALAVANWRCRLTQVDLYNGHRMVVGPALAE